MYVWNITNLCEILPQVEAILNSWPELKKNYILKSITTKYKNSRYFNILDLFRRHEKFQGRETHKILSFLYIYLKINFNKLVPGYE